MKPVLSIFFSVFIASVAHAATEQQMVNESKLAIKDFAAQLKGELMAGMKKGGPVGAIKVCNRVAEEIARNSSEKQGWKISRTALKYRNSKNAPDSWEATILNTFEKRKQAGEAVSKIDHAEVITSDDQSFFRYMKAIPTKALCLSCHGENIAPDISKKLNKLYPDDKARNFKVGDIRGAFSITREVVQSRLKKAL